MTLSQGDRLGRYEILDPIGAGGMGEVWRARDTELGREVAVKVLPESFVGDAVRLERFQREAKALAALSHPNLLDIYDVGTTDGIHYAVTELLEGDTLRERITPTGLPWQKVTEIGAAVAGGLAAAHGRGIVHRDLKLERDVMSTDGGEMLAVVDELRTHGFLEESRELAARTLAWYQDYAAAAPDVRCDPCLAQGLAQALEAAGRHDEACSLFENALADEPGNRWLLQRVGICAARRGDRAEALEMEARIEEIGQPTGPTGVPYGPRRTTQILQAGIAAQLGERSRAIQLIQQAIAAGYNNSLSLHINPDLEPLRNDPEFQEIMRPKG